VGYGKRFIVQKRVFDPGPGSNAQSCARWPVDPRAARGMAIPWTKPGTIATEFANFLESIRFTYNCLFLWTVPLVRVTPLALRKCSVISGLPGRIQRNSRIDLRPEIL
jgi:hypothetical protein